MVLYENVENKNWIRMTWKCTFDMKWPNILYAVRAVLGTFEYPEVLAGDPGVGSVRVNPAEKPEEKSLLVLQGKSKHFKGNVSIAFYTNTKDAVITIPKNLGFSNDYEILSKAVGQFMDTLELRMFTAK
jgi:hypothetical protein